uniref:Uncharacterized protein n=1 Tax=Setaria viridis TaxID=4556 RepID=A0A4U6W374_SETVI|nr:hypothetical protein SEVIR_2G419450v2 [Setaria viridis]
MCRWCARGARGSAGELGEPTNRLVFDSSTSSYLPVVPMMSLESSALQPNDMAAGGWKIAWSLQGGSISGCLVRLICHLLMCTGWCLLIPLADSGW